MSEERRNDVGLKGIVTGCFTVMGIMITLFVHAAWNTAMSGSEKADAAKDLAIKNTIAITELKSMQEDLEKIKNILERYLIHQLNRGDHVKEGRT